jgi:hypothetical protein
MWSRRTSTRAISKIGEMSPLFLDVCCRFHKDLEWHKEKKRRHHHRLSLLPYLVILEVGVALLVVQAIIINRLTGVRYPLWAIVPAPRIGTLASRGALQRFARFL